MRTGFHDNELILHVTRLKLCRPSNSDTLNELFDGYGVCKAKAVAVAGR